MTRAIVSALILSVVVVGVAALLYPRAFPEPGAARSAVERTPAAGDGDGVAAGAGVVGEPLRDPAGARLTGARGAVQVRRGAGEWRDGAAGELLGPDDSVRAGRNAEATLTMGDGVEVRLSPRSELSVRELSEAAARVRLEEGHLTARVEGGKRRVLRVQARGSDAEAESRDGSFGVVTDGHGQLAVATETGSVKLSANGASVEVGAGESSTVAAGRAPAAPQATPRSLFLKVGALASTQTNQTATTVQGMTAPGAIVRVGGQATAADARGEFSIKVPLKDGRNELAVEVVDAAGRAQTEALPPVLVDRRKPGIDAAVQWGR